MNPESVHRVVRKAYGRIAKRGTPLGCCGNSTTVSADTLGYSQADLAEGGQDAYLGLGCGNPLAIAGLQVGETVVDLGSGAGFDCFLAAKRVGSTGKVIGVDMTPEMVERAQALADRNGVTNVSFRLGTIEALPVEDESVDTVFSNCVINLSPDKRQVFREAYRVLRRGGRIQVSDIVLEKPLPFFLRRFVGLYVACVAGALTKEEYLKAIAEAGFKNIRVVGEHNFPLEMLQADPTIGPWIRVLRLIPGMKAMPQRVVSMQVYAEKP
jgi:SAM-dependent methyltransferase